MIEDWLNLSQSSTFFVWPSPATVLEASNLSAHQFLLCLFFCISACLSSQYFFHFFFCTSFCLRSSQPCDLSRTSTLTLFKSTRAAQVFISFKMGKPRKSTRRGRKVLSEDEAEKLLTRSTKKQRLEIALEVRRRREATRAFGRAKGAGTSSHSLSHYGIQLIAWGSHFQTYGQVDVLSVPWPVRSSQAQG